MTEVVDESDPLVIRAFISSEFRRSAFEVARALQIDEAWIARIRDPLVLLVDEEGIWLCPEQADDEPYVSVGWPIIGKLRDGWGPRGEVAEAVGGAVLTILTLGQLGIAGRDSSAVLCVPVTTAIGPIELRIPVDSVDGIARSAERRRPRPKRGPMLQWVPD